MDKLVILLFFSLLSAPLRATTIIVDQNGGGQFINIQAAYGIGSSCCLNDISINSMLNIKFLKGAVKTEYTLILPL